MGFCKYSVIPGIVRSDDFIDCLLKYMTSSIEYLDILHIIFVWQYKTFFEK